MSMLKVLRDAEWNHHVKLAKKTKEKALNLGKSDALKDPRGRRYSGIVRDCNAPEKRERVEWLAVRRSVDWEIPYCLSNSHPVGNSSEHCIICVKIGRAVFQVDVELGAPAVWVCGVGHGQVAEGVVERAVDFKW